MKNFTISILALIAFLIPTAAFAQLTTPTANLAVAIPSGAVTFNPQWCLAPGTASVQLPTVSQAGSILFADKEAATVVGSGTATGCYVVKRGQLGTSANYSHAAQTPVWIGLPATGTGDSSRPFSGGAFTPNIPSGSCVATSQYTLPIIVTGSIGGVGAGDVYTCVAGLWTRGNPQPSLGPTGTGYYPKPFTAFTTPPSGVAINSTSDIAGQFWYSELYVPANATLTGACLLNGATVTTDNKIYVLWDGTGAVIAQTASTAHGSVTSAYNCIAFASTVRVYGPATYYVGIQTTGTTDNFATYAANSVPSTYGVGIQSGVFGTVAAITPSITFTANQGPVMMVY